MKSGAVWNGDGRAKKTVRCEPEYAVYACDMGRVAHVPCKEDAAIAAHPTSSPIWKMVSP